MLLYFEIPYIRYWNDCRTCTFIAFLVNDKSLPCFMVSGQKNKIWPLATVAVSHLARYVPVPKGDVHKKKEVVQETTRSPSTLLHNHIMFCIPAPSKD